MPAHSKPMMERSQPLKTTFTVTSAADADSQAAWPITVKIKPDLPITV